MEEIDYITQGFEDHFNAWRGARIILHGAGDYARALIERFDGEYGFIAVASDEGASAGEFCELPIVPDGAIPSLEPDLVIMTERMRHAVEVYDAIGELCARRGIRLFDMYGLDWHEVRAEIDAQVPLTLSGWVHLVEPYDVVCFEVPDCLLIKLEDMDTSVEKRAVRPIFRRLISLGLSRGREFVFVGRGPMPEEEQIEVLREAGILGGDVSGCEFVMRRGRDGCWREIMARHRGKKVLHIGHGIAHECILPRYYGADTYRMIYRQPMAEEGEALYSGIQARRQSLHGAETVQREAEEAIDASEVVSFDVFDTLLMRRTLVPEDVFWMVEERAQRVGLPVSGFRDVRAKAQRKVGAGNPAFDEIYDDVQRELGLADDVRAWLAACELDVECEVVTVRRPVRALFERAVAKGKRVVLVSDMYLSSEVIAEMLACNGITGYESLVVSCEHGKMKRAGLLEEVLGECEDIGRVVHLGDSWDDDIRPAGNLGVQWVRIPSPRGRAVRNGYGSCTERAETLPEHILLGASVAHAFEDPFSPDIGAVESARPFEFSYLAISPVVVGFLTWICQTLARNPYEGVLFAARDGWLPLAAYREAMKAHPEWELPAATYFYTSRKAAFTACSDQAASLRYLQDKLEYSRGLAPVEHLMASFTGLDASVVEPYEGDEGYSSYIARHVPALVEKSRTCRERYLAYLHKTLGGAGATRYAFVDFVCSGTCQYFLERWVPYKLHGLYFGWRDTQRRMDVDCEPYFLGERPYLLEHYMVLERYLTSGEPSLDGFDEDGDPVFAGEVRSEDELDQISSIQGHVLEFVRWFINLFEDMPAAIDPGFVELMCEVGGVFGMDGEDYDDWGRHRIN